MATLIILILSFFSPAGIEQICLENKYSISQLGRFAMAIMLGFTGASHFIKTAEMVQLMPDFFPYKIGSFRYGSI